MAEHRTLSDVEWVRLGRSHWDARRWDQAEICFQNALTVNPENSVARRRIDDLMIAEVGNRPTVEQVCSQCSMVIPAANVDRCAVCARLLCPQGHCLCTNRALGHPVRDSVAGPPSDPGPRIARCWACAAEVNSEVHSKCEVCHWTYCLNGHCGCGYGG